MAKKKSLPKVKRTVSAFLSNEEGRILKRSIITIGSVAGGIAIAKLISDIIPSVEANSHSNYWKHGFANDIGGRYVPKHCRIEAKHTLHSVATHVNSK
ncbi:MAG: hypothetical protein DRO62_00350 [Candidatus Altiarchaeales archaeon]|nr:MAG: hypothetical protein DRO62_00350 [Candidatus Altiarchaeales archaeon]